MRRLVAIAVVVGALGAGSGARAQKASFDPQLFHPAPGPVDFVTVESAQVLHHLQVGAGVSFDWARDSLSILTYSSRTLDPYGVTVQVQSHVVSAEAWVGLGLIERLQIAVALPMALYETGQDFDGPQPAPEGTHVRAPRGFALGDPRLYLKGKLYGAARGLQLAVSHWLSVPVGNEDALGGAPHYHGFAGEPRALVEWIANRWSLGGYVGFTWRAATTDYYTAGAGQAISYGVGGGVDFLRRRLRFIAELYGHHDFHVDYTAASPLELDVALRVRAGAGVSMTGGVGAGVIAGAGAPLPRVFVALTYERPLRDRDGDGVPDPVDHCPDVAEDKDGFEDEDGCPDPDNDHDTILDREDRCPNQPEDFDGFEDEDGCPDPDNDHDGIDDVHDACPNDPEDGKPPHPHDGCPASKTDTDGDGVPDSVDKCPNEPEDKDGFEDEDGCPEPDNDNDGVPDDYDECPNLAEDQNGIDDEDGCPEGGAKRIHVKDGEIVAEPIRFDGPTPSGAVLALLDDMAAFLKARLDLKVRLEGYADQPGARALALSQTQADAVRAYLVKRGVAAERLTAVGGFLDATPSRRVELRRMK